MTGIGLAPMTGGQSAPPTIRPAEERAETTDFNRLSAADAANLRSYHPRGIGRILGLFLGDSAAPVG
jgi:hypothetical protein